MSFWDSIWDRITDPVGTNDKVTDFLHAATGIPTADDKRNAAKMVTDQVNAYKQQTELSNKMVAEKRQEQLMERRRMDEKQVRAIRGRSSSSGFLGSDVGGDTGNFPDTLGA